MFVAVVVAMMLALSGCGSKSTGGAGSTSGGGAGTGTTQISHTKTKFVLHAGLAFGAFHRWIYKPVKAGDLQHPFLHKLAIVKAGVAGVFVYHELKLAVTDAKADSTLSKLVAPLAALETKLEGVAAGLKHGHVSPAEVTQAQNSMGSINQLASSAREPIANLVPSHL